MCYINVNIQLFITVDYFFELIKKRRLSKDFFEFINLITIMALICPVAAKFQTKIAFNECLW